MIKKSCHITHTRKLVGGVDFEIKQMIRFLENKIILKQCHHTYFQSFLTNFVQTFSDILGLYIVSMKYYDNEYLRFSLSLKICLKLSKGIL